MHGGRPKDVSDEKILGVLANSDDPCVFTSEVANALDWTNPGARKRLGDLEDRGMVESKVNNDRVWWITKKGLEYYRRNM